MRLAVALPNLPPGARHRAVVEETFGELAAGGVEVEGFAEQQRLAGADPGFPLFHYLRIGERQAAAPFDAALWSLARDFFPWEASFLLSRELPGVVWLLDSNLHHLLLGGIGLRKRWHEYGRLVEAGVGDGGAAVADAVIGGWGTAALYRRFPLTRIALGEPAAVVAAWPALAGAVAGEIEVDAVVPLPWSRSGPRPHVTPPAGGTERPRSASSPAGSMARGTLEKSDDMFARSAAGDVWRPHVAFLSVNPAWVGSAIDAVAQVARRLPGAALCVCLPAPVYHGLAAGMAARAGVAERVEWILDAGWERLAEIAARADVLVLGCDDLLAGERVLIVEALARGKLVVVPRAPLYADLPEGVVVKVDPGRAMAPGLAAVLARLAAEPGLRQGLARAARRFGTAAPGPVEAAAALLRVLEASPAPRLRHDEVARPARRRLRQVVRDAVVPPGSSASVRAVFDGVLETLGLRP